MLESCWGVMLGCDIVGKILRGILGSDKEVRGCWGAKLFAGAEVGCWRQGCQGFSSIWALYHVLAMLVQRAMEQTLQTQGKPKKERSCSGDERQSAL